jgi:hypothetical protein
MEAGIGVEVVLKKMKWVLSSGLKARKEIDLR